MEHKMHIEDYTSLQADVTAISAQDVHMGRVLGAILLHVAHAHGLDPAKVEAELAAQSLIDKRAQEDKAIQAEADARVEVRALEDKETLTPSQLAARKLLREQEDADSKAAADTLSTARAQEDADLSASRQPAETPPKEPLARPDPYAHGAKSMPKPMTKEY